MAFLACFFKLAVLIEPFQCLDNFLYVDISQFIIHRQA